MAKAGEQSLCMTNGHWQIPGEVLCCKALDQTNDDEGEPYLALWEHEQCPESRRVSRSGNRDFSERRDQLGT